MTTAAYGTPPPPLLASATSGCTSASSAVASVVARATSARPSSVIRCMSPPFVWSTAPATLEPTPNGAVIAGSRPAKGRKELLGGGEPRDHHRRTQHVAEEAHVTWARGADHGGSVIGLSRRPVQRRARPGARLHSPAMSKLAACFAVLGCCGLACAAGGGAATRGSAHGWTRADLHGVTQPAAIAGRFILYVASHRKLEPVALEERT